MTEAEWLACADPQVMLAGLDSNGRERALRLLCSGCFQRAFHLLETEALRQAAEAFDLFTEGQIDEESFRSQAYATHPLKNYREEMFAGRIREDVWYAAYGVNKAMWPTIGGGFRKVLEFFALAAGSEGDKERAAQTVHIRELFGNPFRPVTIEPSWLRWNGGTVAHLAQAAYNERTLPSGELDRGRLTVLADALEDAGCTVAALLDHLRGPGTHVRGCWAIDHLLGKA
jgi:hypothetical protein